MTGSYEYGEETRFEDRVDPSKLPNPVQSGKKVFARCDLDSTRAYIIFYSTTTGRELENREIRQSDDNSFLLQKNDEEDRTFYRPSKYHDASRRTKIRDRYF